MAKQKRKAETEAAPAAIKKAKNPADTAKKPATQPAAAKLKPAEKGKKKGSEIDDIFGSSKAAAGQEDGELNSIADKVKKAREANAANAKKPKVVGSKDDIFGEQAKGGRKKTEEGFAIYTEDELGLGKSGGDTDLCPFDCDCCF